MSYDFVGRIIDLKERSGQSARGAWKMWELVIEHDTTGQYPRRVLVSLWDENMKDTANYLMTNARIAKVACTVDAKESNGRWFNDIRAFKVEEVVAQQPPYGGGYGGNYGTPPF